MDPHRLRALVHRTVDLDVDSTWSHFLEASPDGSGDDFLAFLKDRDLIDESAFVELHGQDDIELSEPGAEGGEDGEVAPHTRYRLLGPVGVGAMGVVHVAKDVDLRRKVAFKQMRRPTEVQRRRFLHEVQITAQLDHPNVVPVYSIETDHEGRPAYAMKLVRGRTLSSMIKEAREALDRGALPEALALPSRIDHFLKVCQAVEYAHSKGVIHRDLKPDNIMIGRFGEVYVMDWGIAKLVDGADATGSLEVDAFDAESGDPHRRTRLGAVVGTPAYMSPEQANGQLHLVGTPSDVFALGLVLHELVHLAPAYGGQDAALVLAKAIAGRKDPALPTGEGVVSEELEAIIGRACALTAPERYPTVEALEMDLRRWLRGEETVALPDRPRQKLRRWTTRHPGLVLGLLASLVLASVGAAIWNAWQHEVSLAQQRLMGQAREQRVAELVGAVSSRAQHIDNHFLWYEGMLEGIGAAAVYALEHGTPTDGPFYDAAAFRDPATAPPDLTFSARYNKPISAAYPVYKVAPGVPEELWTRDLAVVDGLRDTLRHTFLVAPGDPLPPRDPAAQQARIVAAERSMRWAYVATEASGLMYMFPGAPGWDEKYDARTRPWYREAVGKHGRVWGKPYVDLMGQGRLVSCMLPLYASDGTFLGMAGVDLQFNELLDGLVAMADLPGYVAGYLLEGDQVMLQTTAGDDAIVIPPTEALDDGVDFGRFAYPSVVEAARAGPGHQLVGGQLVVWAPLQHQGWTYVVALDRAALSAP